MTRKLDFLFVSLESGGHVNACIGIAQILLDAGHRVYFVVTELWKGRLAKYGIQEVELTSNPKPEGCDLSTFWSDVWLKAGATQDVPPLEIWKSIFNNVFSPIHTSEVKKMDPQLEQIISKVKPDVIVVDHVLTLPAVELSGIPWINCNSYNPLAIADDHRTPPQRSGLPTYERKDEWKAFRDVMRREVETMTDDYNKFIVSRGLPPMEKYRYFRDSKFMNIYGFPLELDYLDVRLLPPNWFRFDNLKRTGSSGKFEIPEQLIHKPGKLIYFSLGTLGNTDLTLMKRLIGILGQCRHRFIVSMGPKHQMIELADNMWGQQSVPQIQVLSVVDLFITHGGNNSLTEGFYFGTPMLVLPLFSDQHDNAQRVHERGLGLKLNPHKCTKKELLGGIEKILNDKELNEILKNISKRIQTENSIAKLPELIEQRLHEWNNRIK